MRVQIERANSGRTLHGVVRSTWLRGQELTGDGIRGRLLSRVDAPHAATV